MKPIFILFLPLIFLGGCGHPLLKPSREIETFNPTLVGDSDEIHIPLWNSGKSKLNIRRVIIDGNDEGAFTIHLNDCRRAELRRKDDPCEVVIRFTPPEAGRFEAELRMITNGSPRTSIVRLRGAGIQAPQAILEFSSESLDFGEIGIGQSQEEVLRITNKGNGPLDIEDIDISGDGFNILANRDGCSQTRLEEDESCGFIISFAPSSLGERSGSVSIVSNDHVNSRKTIELIGRTPLPKIAYSDASITFSQVSRREQNEVITISNSGVGKLRIQKVYIPKTKAFSIYGQGCSKKELATGEECKIGVLFKPNAPGKYEGDLVIESTDPQDPKITIPLFGVRENQRPQSTNPPLTDDPSETSLPPEISPGQSQSSRKTQDLGNFSHKDGFGDQEDITGTMKQGNVTSYSLRVQKRGDMEILIPAGYSLTGSRMDFTRLKKFASDPVQYRRYFRANVPAGTPIKVTIEKISRSSGNFKFIFKLYPR